VLTLQNNRVAVVPLFDPDTYGHIIIPDQAKERCDQGIVKYLGPKCELVKHGDHVLFSGYTGTTVSLEGEGLLIIMPEDFITAVCEDPVTDVPGLYFRGVDGDYFTATYEQAMNLISKAFTEAPWFARLKFNVDGGLRTRPKPEEYERLR